MNVVLRARAGGRLLAETAGPGHRGMLQSRPMPDASSSYDELITRVRETALLGSVSSVLHWDERTYMPPKGAEHRANQASLLARMKHEKFTSPRIGELLSRVEGSDLVRDPESDAAVNGKDIRREYDRATKLPPAFVEEMTKTEVLGQQAWAEARTKSDFKTFEPWLTKTVNLKEREAAYVGYKESPYDALLDPFEP